MLNLNTEAYRKFQEQCARGTQSTFINNPEQIYAGEPRGTKNKATKLHEITTATWFEKDGAITVSQTETTVTQVETNMQHLAHFVAPTVLDALPQIASNSVTKTNPLPASTPSHAPIEMRMFRSRTDKIGKAQQITFAQIAQKFGTPYESTETMKEYDTWTDSEKTEAKDKGAYLLAVTDGKGKKAINIKTRTAGAIDVDDTDADTIPVIEKIMHGIQYLLHATRRSRIGAERYRIVLPFDKPITPEEYKLVILYVTDLLKRHGVTADSCVERETQIMFLPTTSCDQRQHYEECFKYVDTFIDADTSEIIPCGRLNTAEVIKLAGVYAPQKTASIPQRIRSVGAGTTETQKSVPPKERKGFEGTFCRAISAHEALEMLPETFKFDTKSGRWEYADATTGASIVINPDDTIHSYGKTGELGTKSGYQHVLRFMFAGDARAMQLHFSTDPRIVKELEKEHGEGEAWKAQLKRTENGKIKNIGANLELIAKYDTRFRNNLRFNLRNGFIEISGKLPWSRKGMEKYWDDYDTIKLSTELGKSYDIETKAAAEDFTYHIREFTSYEPLQEYMTKAFEAWDGKPRVRDLFIKLLGAEDNDSIRAFTELFFKGGVARIFNAGCKFDEMIILMGQQGVGKSKLLKKLAIHDDFHTDSLTTFSGDESYMKIRNVFIVEVGELTALRKSDEEAAKQFISATHDTYRTKFEKYATPKARRCIFAGTTNKSAFLRDPTGNRRFLPIMCHNEKNDCHKVYAVTDEEVQQIWGEAVHLYRKNPKLVLPREAQAHAMELQKEHAQLPQGITEFEAWLEEESVNFVAEKNLYENWLKVNEIGKRTSNNDKLVREALDYVKHTLKWEYDRISENGVRKRGYRRPKA